MQKKMTSFDKRKQRVRFSLRKKSNGKLRLSIFRSNKHIYAQIIDDALGCTIASASTSDKEFNSLNLSSNVASVHKVGELIARKALQIDVKEVVFDRGGYIYHGKVKALADAARSAGLKF